MKKYKVTFRDGSSFIVDAQTLSLRSASPNVFIISSTSTPSFKGIDGYMKSKGIRQVYVVFSNKYTSKARQLLNSVPSTVRSTMGNKAVEVDGYDYDSYYELTLR